MRHFLHRPADERLVKPFRRYWLRLLRHQWRECDRFRFNNWPGAVPDDVGIHDAPHYPAYQSEAWRALSTLERPNPGFQPDGITLIGPLTPQVFRILIQPDPLGRVCTWFDVQLSMGDRVLFSVHDWGATTVVDVSEQVWERLRIPRTFCL